MKLGTKGRYAVMAMVDLAQSGHDHPVTLSNMATRQELSPTYLEQLFVKLRRNGLVKSIRGPGGGFILSKPAGDICVADIMTAVGEPIQTTRCKNIPEIGCRTSKTRCSTHDLWAALGSHIQDFLARISLDDICNNKIQVPVIASTLEHKAQPSRTQMEH